MLKILSLFASFCSAVMVVQGQITLNPAQTPEALVKDLFIGDGIRVRNVKYTGAPMSLGSYKNPSAKPHFKEAIVISTGKAADVAGPHDNPKTSTSTGGPSDKNLAGVAGGRTFDAASLDFDFIADKDSVSFNYFFASEEYNDYVGSTFNDAFAIIVTGAGLRAGKNLAVLPGTEIPITVNSVNVSQNRQHYVDNNPYNLVGRINEEQKAKLDPELLANFEFDGLTKVFSASLQVVPMEIYHVQIIIADAGDGTVDSAVLLEAGSFKSFEQRKHEIRRQEIAAKLRADSLARAAIVEDSLRLSQLQRDSLQGLEITKEHPLSEPQIQTTTGEQKLTIIFHAGDYRLTEQDQLQLSALGKQLQENPKLKAGIFTASGESEMLLDMRYELVRFELKRAGANEDQLFKNEFTFSEPNDPKSPQRIEVWVK